MSTDDRRSNEQGNEFKRDTSKADWVLPPDWKEYWSKSKQRSRSLSLFLFFSFSVSPPAPTIACFYLSMLFSPRETQDRPSNSKLISIDERICILTLLGI